MSGMSDSDWRMNLKQEDREQPTVSSHAYNFGSNNTPNDYAKDTQNALESKQQETVSESMDLDPSNTNGTTAQPSNRLYNTNTDTIIQCVHDLEEMIPLHPIPCTICGKNFAKDTEMWCCQNCAAHVCIKCLISVPNKNTPNQENISPDVHNSTPPTKRNDYQKPNPNAQPRTMPIDTGTLRNFRRKRIKLELTDKNAFKGNKSEAFKGSKTGASKRVKLKKDGTEDQRTKHFKDNEFFQKNGFHRSERNVNASTKKYIGYRQKYKCFQCEQIMLSWDVHHWTPLKDGGTNDANNLIALCPTCHRNIHIRKRLFHNEH
eukprot:58657_1